MLFPQIKPEDWAKAYHLEVAKRKCLKCKKEILIDIPIATKNYRGFRSQEHGCPEEYHQYILSPSTTQEQQSLLEAKID